MWFNKLASFAYIVLYLFFYFFFCYYSNTHIGYYFVCSLVGPRRSMPGASFYKYNKNNNYNGYNS